MSIDPRNRKLLIRVLLLCPETTCEAYRVACQYQVHLTVKYDMCRRRQASLTCVEDEEVSMGSAVSQRSGRAY